MWQFWIDVGGTFTDCVAVQPDGGFRANKVLSSGRLKGQLVDGAISILAGYEAGLFVGWTVQNADSSVSATILRSESTGEIACDAVIASGPVEIFSGEIAPVVAIRLMLGLRLDETIPPIGLKLGTTRGTNALLERAGARVGLLTTQGFGDVLHIGTQQRPDLFAIDIVKNRPLTHAVAEVDERTAADGTVLREASAADVEACIRRLVDAGCETIAIAFVNSYANRSNEQRAGSIARAMGIHVVSESSAIANVVQFLPRTETAVLDAYLEPSLRAYIASLEAALSGSRIQLMTSAGGLVSPAAFRGTASLLSGPAGGVVGCEQVARDAGMFDGPDSAAGAIGFDMGGTSTDVCRVDRVRGVERVQDKIKAGVRIAASTVAIETVAAGGGSICGFDGVKLTVGPASAGADPGPACYGRGGPLTVTDCNVLLGRVVSDEFPFPLDIAAARTRLHELKQHVAAASPDSLAPTEEELARGFFKIATENMALAVRRVTVADGYDPSRDVLVTFGGAGGQYACAVADELGCSKVLVHPYAGLLSAYGIGHADERAEANAPVSKLLDDWSRQECGQLTEQVRKKLPEATQYDRQLDLRYSGTESTITVPFLPSDSLSVIRGKFNAAHKRRYGYERDRAIEVTNVRVIGSTRGSNSPFTLNNERWPAPPSGVAEQPIVMSDPYSTTVIDPGWSAKRLPNGSLLVTESEAAGAAQSATTEMPQAVRLELFHSRFASIAEQMGVVLLNTAVSTNVKERLDFSCAVFDAAGRLVVNAPHIPVHLGAMGETVRHFIKSQTIQHGDVFVTNDPYHGGSHLPDVTVVTPVFVDDGGNNPQPQFYVASRAHHAEIGGIVPGSIPPNSTSLADEGVLIRDFKLVAAGEDNSDALAKHLASGPFPSRNIADNMADIAAQSAANQTGVVMLLELVGREGINTVQSMMTDIRAAAATKTRNALRQWFGSRATPFHATDQLDDGAMIAVTIAINDGVARFDFDGTDPVVPSNLNANRGIVTAAVLYTLRLLLGRVDPTAASMPLNEGVLDPVEIVLPDCLLNPTAHADPSACAAVVGGNTETSQRIVDVLLQALGLAACSQGTMNNVTFGNAGFGYYETIAGGAGASSLAAGADAAQVHMTNTRMTDVEILEQRYPVRVRKFAIRLDSGGRGRHAGGDGVVRELEFLEPLSLSLLTGRRTTAPRGSEGGDDGANGQNTLIRADGTTERLAWRQQLSIQAGDRLRIETPGGGGFGKVEKT